MEYDRKETGTGRWIASTVIAAAGMLLFLLLAVTAFREQRLPDPGPILELDYVTIEEPRKNPPVEPPRVKPRERKKEEQPEAALPEEVPPLPEPVETEPAQSEAAELPAPPPEPVPGVEPATGTPQRIDSPTELDNTGFEPIFNPKPEYPRVALEARITGYVDVDLVINGDGKVESFSIVSVKGHSSFGDATAKVLPRWRFPPPRIGGKKTGVRYMYRINFVLN